MRQIIYIFLLMLGCTNQKHMGKINKMSAVELISNGDILGLKKYINGSALTNLFHKREFSHRDDKGRPLIFFIIDQGNPDILEWALSEKLCSLADEDYAGLPALHYIIENMDINFSTKEKLLESVCSAYIATDTKHRSTTINIYLKRKGTHENISHIISRKNWLPGAEILNKKALLKPMLTERNNNGSTPLFIFCSYFYERRDLSDKKLKGVVERFIELLISEESAIVDVPNNFGSYLIHAVAANSSGHYLICHILKHYPDTLSIKTNKKTIEDSKKPIEIAFIARNYQNFLQLLELEYKKMEVGKRPAFVKGWKAQIKKLDDKEKVKILLSQIPDVQEGVILDDNGAGSGDTPTQNIQSKAVSETLM